MSFSLLGPNAVSFTFLFQIGVRSIYKFSPQRKDAVSQNCTKQLVKLKTPLFKTTDESLIFQEKYSTAV
jgi:hypothetical protein